MSPKTGIRIDPHEKTEKDMYMRRLGWNAFVLCGAAASRAANESSLYSEAITFELIRIKNQNQPCLILGILATLAACLVTQLGSSTCPGGPIPNQGIPGLYTDALSYPSACIPKG